MTTVKITILCENTAGKPQILGEHGFSALIEDSENKILFDTGGGYTIKHNAHILNIDLSQISTVVLSHGHYDHTGGLPYLLDTDKNLTRLYAHPNAFTHRYVQDSNNVVREIGYRGPEQNVLSQRLEVIHTQFPTQITPNIIATGEISKTNNIEDAGGAFYIDSTITTPDPIIDDQSLIIVGNDTYILITGCCHSGIINTLKYITDQIVPKTKEAIIIGGLHLHQASPERLNFTLANLKQYSVKSIYPCHCTGFNAIKYLSQHLTIDICPLPAGGSLLFNI